ncbi:MAG: hypothetical protein ACK5HY_09570 [Parahaliea sp.]
MNNVEVIEVGAPMPGEWTVQVVASNVPQGPQDCALVLLGHFGAPGEDGGEQGEEMIVTLEAAPHLPIPDNAAQGVSSTHWRWPDRGAWKRCGLRSPLPTPMSGTCAWC